MKALFKPALLLGALATFAGIGAAQAQDIKIGFNSDISASPSALVGQAGLAGMEAAVADINAAGGVLGRKLEIVVRDDMGQPQTAIQNAVELINNEKVVALFGASNSGNIMAWKNMANQKKVPVLVPLATGTDVTKPSSPSAPNYIFRISLVDRYNVAGLLAYVSKTPNAKKVGFMAETTGYGQGALKDMQELAPLYGITPVATEKFGVGDTDMTSQLNKMKSAGVDIIVVWAQTTPLAQLFRSMEKLNYFPITLTPWVADQTSFAQAAGPTLIGKPIFMRTRAGDPMSPEMAKLFERVKGKASLGEPPIAQASQAYDAVMLLALAIKQANSTDGTKIKDALENLEGSYQGLMKTYDKPFSTTRHEALGPTDYHWVRWDKDKVISYSDDVTKSLTPSDFKN